MGAEFKRRHYTTSQMKQDGSDSSPKAEGKGSKLLWRGHSAGLCCRKSRRMRKKGALLKVRVTRAVWTDHSGHLGFRGLMSTASKRNER